MYIFLVHRPIADCGLELVAKDFKWGRIFPMKAMAAKDELFLTDAKGKRTGVVLALSTYQRLREAEEELAEIQAYDAARPKVLSEIAAGHFTALGEYRAVRGRKSK